MKNPAEIASGGVEISDGLPLGLSLSKSVSRR
jgi:hypothetical protein